MGMAVNNHVGNPPMCFLLTLNYHTILCTFLLANITNKRALCIYRGGGGPHQTPNARTRGPFILVVFAWHCHAKHCAMNIAQKNVHLVVNSRCVELAIQWIDAHLSMSLKACRSYFTNNQVSLNRSTWPKERGQWQNHKNLDCAQANTKTCIFIDGRVSIPTMILISCLYFTILLGCLMIFVNRARAWEAGKLW